MPRTVTSILDGRSVVEELLKPDQWVLDGGCRVYYVTDEMLRRGMKVLAVDPSPTVTKRPQDDKFIFERAALVGVPRDAATFYDFGNGQGSYLEVTRRPRPAECSVYRVPCLTVSELMRKHEIDHFGLVKLNVEGAEYDILANWPGPIADQIMVSFHDCFECCPDSEPQRFYSRLFTFLDHWYVVARHEKETRWGMENYWDSLLVLRSFW